MLVGAFVAAFKIGNWQSFQYNLVPIVVYTATCLLLKPKWQLLLSQMLSTFYALIMMAVIVGTALQLGEDGIGSPSAIFLMAMVGSFFIAACLHPQEFWCVVPGLIYLLCIPSMYLLLIIYRYFQDFFISMIVLKPLWKILNHLIVFLLYSRFIKDIIVKCTNKI